MPTSVSGVTELRLAMTKYGTDLGKETKKEMAKALKPIVTKARGYLPSNGSMLSGWTSPSSSDSAKYRPFPKYDQAEAKRGVKYSTTPSKPNRNGFVALARVINASAGGAIYETAGRKSGADGQPTFTRTKFTPESYREDGKGYNKSLNPNAGKQFIARANSNGKLVNARALKQAGRPSRKMTGRVIFRALAEDQGKAVAAVMKAIENSNSQFYKNTKVK